MTREDVERSVFAGAPISGLDREGLLDVIVALYEELENSRRAHDRTLSAWSAFQWMRSR